MRVHSLTPAEWVKAILVGIVVALLLSAIMVPAAKMGISPMPKPLAPAFAMSLLGRPVPLPVGLGFHVVWVTFWSVAFVVLFRDRLTFTSALTLALALWALVLLVFFPIVGWGFLGLAEGPMLIVGALVTHLLFALFLWLGCKLAF